MATYKNTGNPFGFRSRDRSKNVNFHRGEGTVDSAELDYVFSDPSQRAVKESIEAKLRAGTLVLERDRVELEQPALAEGPPPLEATQPEHPDFRMDGPGNPGVPGAPTPPAAESPAPSPREGGPAENVRHETAAAPEGPNRPEAEVTTVPDARPSGGAGVAERTEGGAGRSRGSGRR